MTVAIFALMTAALLLAQVGLRAIGVAALLVALAVSAGLFLYEVHTPADGWRMPWLQVRAASRSGLSG